MNLCSAALFYLATLLLHDAAARHAHQAFAFAFVRYLLGALLFAPFFLRSTSRSWPRAFTWSRSIFNAAAVGCFYYSVEMGGPARANVLNMTYPAFVAVLAGPMLGERPGGGTLLLIGVAMLGALVHAWRPGSLGFSEADLWGLASGALAGFAIASLRGAARESSAEIILFWMFTVGALLTAPLALMQLSALLDAALWLWILPAALAGVAGQWLLTVSYRSLDASIGSVLSMARIPIAVFCGLFFLNESIGMAAGLGAALILLSNVLLAFGRKRAKNGSTPPATAPSGSIE